jgi:hypothetical protein
MVMDKRSKTKEKKRSRESFSIAKKNSLLQSDELEIQLNLTTELMKKKVKISDDLESSIDDDSNQIYFAHSTGSQEEGAQQISSQEPEHVEVNKKISTHSIVTKMTHFIYYFVK